jgi:hypothetical protein
MYLRFKTEKELRKKYGPEWREVVSPNFPDRMDYLLGQRVTKRLERALLVEGLKWHRSPRATTTDNDNNRWYIGWNLLTEEKDDNS